MAFEYAEYFHKGLPHNRDGSVDVAAFKDLVRACGQDNHVPDPGLRFEAVKIGGDVLANPLAGFGSGDLGPMDFSQVKLREAPPISSKLIAAEAVELCWMALLRDLPFSAWHADADVGRAAAEIDTYVAAAERWQTARKWGMTRRIGGDFPDARISPANIFRGTAPGEDVGPYLSQFWWKPTPYGTQTIPAEFLVYKEGKDYLETFDDWLNAQRTGLGAPNAMYPNGPDYGTSNRVHDHQQPGNFVRRLQTMRDLASFVHRDALHQAYFNAALQLLHSGKTVRKSALDPYNRALNPHAYRKMRGFGTFGAPHLLSLVSEVASRALRLQWFQKWRIHRRLRPEAFMGLAHIQELGVAGTTHNQSIQASLFKAECVQRLKGRNGTILLPMAYESGCPMHPAYGAGHATVAGACVTILKAWFHEMDEFPDPMNEDGSAYHGRLTVRGELNKLASNVAMGRSMGGVHFRSDNMRSLKMGEILATVMLGNLLTHVAERQRGRPPKFGYENFDGDKVTIEVGPKFRPQVRVGKVLSDAYAECFDPHSTKPYVV